jgi:quinol monooxygenase YgiN
MVIVAGHLLVDPEQREAHLAGFMRVVEKARQADGCLDFAMTADPLDPGRVNLFERWESQEAVKAFRRRAPRPKHRAAVLSGSVAEYDVAAVRPLFGKNDARRKTA